VNTEDRIQAARRFYNGNVRDYRNTCESLPSGLVASALGFETEDYFGAEDAEREEPAVTFGPSGP
jgi:LemA protein